MTDEFQSAIDMIAQQCIASRLRELNRFVTKIYDEALRSFGVTIGQLNLLVAIAHLGEAKPAALIEMFHMDASTLSRNVDRMRSKGWLTTNRGKDGRTSLLSLTLQGRELLLGVTPAWKQAQEQAAELLGREGVTTLHQLARSLEHVEK